MRATPKHGPNTLAWASVRLLPAERVPGGSEQRAHPRLGVGAGHSQLKRNRRCHVATVFLSLQSTVWPSLGDGDSEEMGFKKLHKRKMRMKPVALESSWRYEY